MQYENATPGSNGTHQTTSVASTEEVAGEASAYKTGPSPDQVLDALFSLHWKARTLEPSARRAYLSAIGACVTAVSQDVDPLVLADALAGGSFDGAVGHLFELRIGDTAEEIVADTDFALDRLLGTIRPEVRSAFVTQLHRWLTNEEKATLARTLDVWPDDALATFIPNVELWFADLDQSEQRELTDFVLAAAVEAGTAVRFPSRA